MRGKVVSFGLISNQIEKKKKSQESPTIHYSYPYQKHPPRDKSRILIILAAIIVVAVVISAVIFIWIINPGNEVSAIFFDFDYSDPDNLGVNVIVDSGGVLSLAGEADLWIFYQDREVYNSKVQIDSSGDGFLSIPYNSFVEGNGEYNFLVEYRNVESMPYIYNVGYVVELLDMDVVVDFVDGGGLLTIFINMLYEDGDSMLDNPKDVILTVNEILSVDDWNYITYGDEPQNISAHFFSNEYPYNKSGNYLVNVSLENTRVNPDSSSLYFTIYETWEGFLNILPEAEAQIVNTYPTPNSSNYTVEFDASNSWNDGDITNYIWDFNGDGAIDLETIEPKVNFSEYSQNQSYNTVLNVEGDVIINPYLGIKEKGSFTIRVDPP